MQPAAVLRLSRILGRKVLTFAKHFSTLPLTLRPLSIQPFVITLSSYDAGAALRTLRAPTAAHKPSAEVMRNAAQSLRVTQRWLRGHAVLVCVRECAVLRHSVQFDRRASGRPCVCGICLTVLSIWTCQFSQGAAAAHASRQVWTAQEPRSPCAATLCRSIRRCGVMRLHFTDQGTCVRVSR